MNIVIATDLYGITEPLRAICSQLLEGYSLSFLSPWSTDTHSYADEKTAHQAFMQSDGFNSYRAKITQTLNALADAPVMLIGFSVGATAGWLYACDPAVRADAMCWLFYGSRIRDYADQTVRVARINTIWAQYEDSFDPADLSRTLMGRGILAEVVAGTTHGFMNPNSTHYRADCLAHYLSRVALACEQGQISS